MKYAADFRRIAREALSGRWGIAVIAGLLATLLGAVSSGGPELNFEINDNGANLGVEFAGQQIFSSGTGWNEQLTGILIGGTAIIILSALVSAVIFFVLGGVLEVGYSSFNLDLVDRRKQPEIGTMFGYFPRWKTAAAAKFLRGLYAFLWGLLFIVPGIVVSYSYAMTGYILAEHPELSAQEAMERSKQMMYGNRFRLFCLEISFIGWSLLCLLTFGIGNLWLTPYVQTATAAFYREISDTEHVVASGEANL